MDRIPEGYFELFSLPVRYALDLGELERRYKALLLEIHPDRHAAGSGQEKRLAVQYSGLANEAYDTLASPLKRGAYILGRHGLDPFDELDTDMPGEFLLRQIEIREALENAIDDIDSLREQKRELSKELAEYEKRISALLDEKEAWADACRQLREMSYLVKILMQIDQSIGRLGD